MRGARPLIDRVQEGALAQVILQRGEGKCSAEIRRVTEAATADVRNIYAGSYQMLAMCSGKEVIELHMIFGRPPIRLSAASGESVLNDQLWNARVEAVRPTILMPDAAG
jgi:hypothetical protein